MLNLKIPVYHTAHGFQCQENAKNETDKCQFDEDLHYYKCIVDEGIESTFTNLTLADLCKPDTRPITNQTKGPEKIIGSDSNDPKVTGWKTMKVEYGPWKKPPESGLADKCLNAGWWGLSETKGANAKITFVFTGPEKGKIDITFGNCGQKKDMDGIVELKVYKLDGIDTTTAKVNETKEVEIKFQKDVKLEITENDGIIRIDRFLYYCSGCKIFKFLSMNS